MRNSSERGLTLTEALVAVAILAALAAAIAPAVAGAIRSAARIARSSAESESLRETDALLRRLALGAVWPTAETRADVPEGDETSLRLLTFAQADGKPAIATLEITGGKLKISMAPSWAPEERVETILSTGLRDLRFRYYGRETKDAPVGWRTSWHAARPPLLISLVGTRQGADRSPRQIAIDALVGGQAPIVCEYDAVSRECRGEI